MDTCDLCGGDAKSYGPRGRRCLACLAADDPALRSDVPALGECDWGPLCVHLASVRRLRTRLAFSEIARAEAVRAGRGANGTLPAALNEAWSHGQWLSAEWRKAEASADAAHAALDALTAKIAEVERILTNWPADGAYALRVLRGEEKTR